MRPAPHHAARDESGRQAHQPNEFIEIVQVEACVTLLRKLRNWAAVG